MSEVYVHWVVIEPKPRDVVVAGHLMRGREPALPCKGSRASGSIEREHLRSRDEIPAAKVRIERALMANLAASLS